MLGARGSKLEAAVQGAVAQLGERLVCNQEATGSIPVSSTKEFKHAGAKMWTAIRLLLSLALSVPLAEGASKWLPFRTPGELMADVAYPPQPCCQGMLPHFGQRLGLSLMVDVALCFCVLYSALGPVVKWRRKRVGSA